MEMTGTFGKILASVSTGAEEASMDAETEVRLYPQNRHRV